VRYGAWSRRKAQLGRTQWFANPPTKDSVPLSQLSRRPRPKRTCCDGSCERSERFRSERSSRPVRPSGLDRDLPDNVEVSDSTPHAEVLPRTALVVTHAGLGTAMTGLAHGVPPLCLPMGVTSTATPPGSRSWEPGSSSRLTPTHLRSPTAYTRHSSLLKQNAGRLAITIREEIAAEQASRSSKP
jgi:hypothetical protein